jgi:hypothetical protein
MLPGHSTGCGPRQPKIEYADVTGKVSYKGEPLKMGTVSFQPTFGARAVGDIQSDGTFKLKGVVGPNTVTIASHEPGAQPGGPDAQKMMKSDPKTYIPMKYSTAASGLKFDVQGGKANTANFDLE